MIPNLFLFGGHLKLLIVFADLYSIQIDLIYGRLSQFFYFYGPLDSLHRSLVVHGPRLSAYALSIIF